MIRTKQLARENDATLVRHCLDGDALAWEALIKRYSGLIYSIPADMGLPNEDCADVLQSVALTLLTNLQAVREIPRLSSWLATTASNTCLQLFRRRSRESLLGDGADSVAQESRTALPATKLMRIEERAQIRRGIDELGAPCRDILVALYYEHPSPTYAVIAERLGLPPSGIGPTRARCLERLRTILVHLGFS